MQIKVRNWLAAIALLFAASWAGAQATIYTGTSPTTYTSLVPFTPPCALGPCQNYTSAMSLSGTFTTTSPLAANLVSSNIYPLISAFSFSDGISTYSSTDPDARVHSFAVSTDASGAIISTVIALERWQTGSAPRSTSDRLSYITTGALTFSTHNTACSSLGSGPAGVPDTCTVTGSDSSRSTATGPGLIWSSALAPTPASVPTLSGWSMIILAGLLGLASFAALRRKSS